MSCAPWCDDHLKDLDLDYCMSTERKAGAHGLVLVGPGHDDSGEGGIFWVEKLGGPFGAYPFDREMAMMLLADLRTSFVQKVSEELQRVEALHNAIREVWG